MSVRVQLLWHGTSQVPAKKSPGLRAITMRQTAGFGPKKRRRDEKRVLSHAVRPVTHATSHTPSHIPWAGVGVGLRLGATLWLGVS